MKEYKSIEDHLEDYIEVKKVMGKLLLSKYAKDLKSTKIELDKEQLKIINNLINFSFNHIIEDAFEDRSSRIKFLIEMSEYANLSNEEQIHFVNDLLKKHQMYPPKLELNDFVNYESIKFFTDEELSDYVKYYVLTLKDEYRNEISYKEIYRKIFNKFKIFSDKEIRRVNFIIGEKIEVDILKSLRPKSSLSPKFGLNKGVSRTDKRFLELYSDEVKDLSRFEGYVKYSYNVENARKHLLGKYAPSYAEKIYPTVLKVMDNFAGQSGELEIKKFNMLSKIINKLPYYYIMSTNKSSFYTHIVNLKTNEVYVLSSLFFINISKEEIYFDKTNKFKQIYNYVGFDKCDLPIIKEDLLKIYQIKKEKKTNMELDSRDIRRIKRIVESFSKFDNPKYEIKVDRSMKDVNKLVKLKYSDREYIIGLFSIFDVESKSFIYKIDNKYDSIIKELDKRIDSILQKGERNSMHLMWIYDTLKTAIDLRQSVTDTNNGENI